MSWFAESPMPHGDDFFSGGVEQHDTTTPPDGTAGWFSVFREAGHRGYGPEVTRAMAAAHPEAALAAAAEVESTMEFFLDVFRGIGVEDLYISPAQGRHAGLVSLRHGFSDRYRDVCEFSVEGLSQFDRLTAWMKSRCEIGRAPTPEEALDAWKRVALAALKEEYTSVLTGIHHAREAIAKTGDDA